MITTFDGNVWYLQLYDCDSCLGLDNSGALKFDSDIEVEAGVFNTSNSRLWEKLRRNFPTQILAQWEYLRLNEFTEENIMKYLVDNISDKIPEINYNLDAWKKYINLGQELLFACHGNRRQQIQRWIKERIIYVDTLLQYTVSTNDYITVRVNKMGEVHFDIQAFQPMYFSIKFRNESGGTITHRITRGETVRFSYNIPVETDQEILVYGGRFIKDLGDLSDMNPTNLLLGNATRLTKLKCTNADRLINASISGCVSLQEVDLHNCSNLGAGSDASLQTLDLSACRNLRTVDISGTQLTALYTSQQGGIIQEILYPYSIQIVRIQNQARLTSLGIPCYYTGNYNDERNIFAERLSEMTVSNCPNVKTFVKNYYTNEDGSEVPVPTFIGVSKGRTFNLSNVMGHLTQIDLSYCSNIESLTLDNFNNLTEINFDDIAPYNATTSNLHNLTLTNCPNVETLTFNQNTVDGENSLGVAFKEGTVLDLSGLYNLKHIRSNVGVKGLKKLILPLTILSLVFNYPASTTYAYGESDIEDIFSKNALHETDGFKGIDLLDIETITDFSMGSLTKINNAINLDVKITDTFPYINYFKTDNYFKPEGTIDISEYKGSLEYLFKGVDLDKLTVVCSEPLPHTSAKYMFAYASGENVEVLNTLFNYMPNATDFSYMFYCGYLKHAPLIPIRAENVSYMFYNNETMETTPSNWLQAYPFTPISDYCYTGCSGIIMIDDAEGSIDVIPVAWGGFDRKNAVVNGETIIVEQTLEREFVNFTANGQTFQNIVPEVGQTPTLIANKSEQPVGEGMPTNILLADGLMPEAELEGFTLANLASERRSSKMTCNQTENDIRAGLNDTFIIEDGGVVSQLELDGLTLVNIMPDTGKTPLVSNNDGSYDIAKGLDEGIILDTGKMLSSTLYGETMINLTSETIPSDNNSVGYTSSFEIGADIDERLDIEYENMNDMVLHGNTMKNLCPQQKTTGNLTFTNHENVVPDILPIVIQDGEIVSGEIRGNTINGIDVEFTKIECIPPNGNSLINEVEQPIKLRSLGTTYDSYNLVTGELIKRIGVSETDGSYSVLSSPIVSQVEIDNIPQLYTNGQVKVYSDSEVYPTTILNGQSTNNYEINELNKSNNYTIRYDGECESINLNGKSNEQGTNRIVKSGTDGSGNLTFINDSGDINNVLLVQNDVREQEINHFNGLQTVEINQLFVSSKRNLFEPYMKADYDYTTSDGLKYSSLHNGVFKCGDRATSGLNQQKYWAITKPHIESFGHYAVWNEALEDEPIMVANKIYHISFTMTVTDSSGGHNYYLQCYGRDNGQGGILKWLKPDYGQAYLGVYTPSGGGTVTTHFSQEVWCQKDVNCIAIYSPYSGGWEFDCTITDLTICEPEYAKPDVPLVYEYIDLPQPVQLNSLLDGTHDTYNPITGEYVQNVGYLKASDATIEYGSNTTTHTFTIRNSTITNPPILTSGWATYLESSVLPRVYNETSFGISQSNIGWYIGMHIPKTMYPIKEDALQWILNNVIILYKAKDPITTQLTPINIPTFEGGILQLITTDGKVFPMVEYSMPTNNRYDTSSWETGAVYTQRNMTEAYFNESTTPMTPTETMTLTTDHISSGSIILNDNGNGLIVLNGDYTGRDIPYFTGMRSVEAIEVETTNSDSSIQSTIQLPPHIQLHSLPDGTRDEVDIKTGILTRNVGYVVLDGSEDELWNDSLGNAYPTEANTKAMCLPKSFIELPSIDRNKTNILVTYFKPLSTGYTNSQGYEVMAICSDDKYHIQFVKQGISTLTEWREYLSQNPVTIYYKQQTPTTERLILNYNNSCNYGRILPTGMCDKYDVVNSMYTQTMTSILLDGENTWDAMEEMTNVIKFTATGTTVGVENLNMLGAGGLYCDNDLFPNINDDSDVEHCRVDEAGNKFYIYISKDRLMSPDLIGWQIWLQANPFNLIYELAEHLTYVKQYEELDPTQARWEGMDCMRDGAIRYHTNSSDNITMYPTLEYVAPSINNFEVTMLEPNTDYTIYAEGINTNDTINFGGTDINFNNGTVYTSGDNQWLRIDNNDSFYNVVITKGDTTGEVVPYFEGMTSVENPMIETGVKLVTDGLICYLDANDLKPGDTIWRDKSGNGNDFELVNNPIIENGYVYFKRATKSGAKNSNLSLNIHNMTVQMSIKNITNVGNSYIFSSGSYVNGFNISTNKEIGTLRYTIHGETNPMLQRNTQISTDYNSFITAISSQDGRYLSNEGDFENTLDINQPGDYLVTGAALGHEIGFAGGDGLDGQFRSLLIYDRPLTKEEIEQNYTYETFQINKNGINIDVPSYSKVSYTDLKLRSLPNGVKDTINVVTGEYVQRVGEVVLNGSEDWILSAHDNSTLFYTPLNNLVRKVDYLNSMNCDKLVVHIDSEDLYTPALPNGISGYSDWREQYPNENWIYIKYADSEGYVEKLKQWLKENPVTVQYELKEPITTKLDPQTLLAYTDGTINLSSDTGFLPTTHYTVPSTNTFHLPSMKTGTRYTLKYPSASGSITIGDINYSISSDSMLFTTPLKINGDTSAIIFSDANPENVVLLEGAYNKREVPFFTGVKSVKNPNITIIDQLSTESTTYNCETEIELRGLPNGVADKLDIVKGKLTTNVGIRPYQEGDENLPNIWTDGYETVYALSSPVVKNVTIDRPTVTTNSLIELSSDYLIPQLNYRAPSSNNFPLDLLQPNTTYTLYADTLASGSYTLGGTKTGVYSQPHIITLGAMTDNLLTFNGDLGLSNVMLVKGNSLKTSLPPYFLGIRSVTDGHLLVEGMAGEINEITFDEGIVLRDCNGVKDIIDLITCTLTKRTGEITLTGAEGWYRADSESTTDYNVFKLTLGGLKEALVMCDTLQSVFDTKMMDCIHAHTNELCIVIANATIGGNTVNALKSWLNQHPTTVVYQLRVPIEVQLENVWTTTPPTSYDNQTEISSTVSTSSLKPMISVTIATTTLEEIISNLEAQNAQLEEENIATMLALTSVYETMVAPSVATTSVKPEPQATTYSMRRSVRSAEPIGMSVSPMGMVYARLVSKGFKSIDEVPYNLQAEVMYALRGME